MVLGDTPYMVRGGQEDYKRVFYSDQNRALTKPISILPGYGVLPGGTVMGIVTEGRVGYYVPYAAEGPNTPGAGFQKAWPGITYVTLDLTTDKVCQIMLADSYRFAVDDHVAATDTDDTETDAGAITAIDRTTYSHIAVLTSTNNFAAATVAKGGNVYIQTAAGDPFTKAQGILFSAVDTGYGEKAKGAQATLVLSNAILYKAALLGYNSDVKTDLGNTEDGKYVILK